MTCSQPPEGRAGWTLRLLADQLVECEIVVSTETVRYAEKNELKPWLKECWCIPRKGSAEFVCAEDVLESITANTGRGLGVQRPLQVKETRLGRPSRPGAAASYRL